MALAFEPGEPGLLTVPLGWDEWSTILAVGIAGGEVDKWRNRRRRRTIG